MGADYAGAAVYVRACVHSSSSWQWLRPLPSWASKWPTYRWCASIVHSDPFRCVASNSVDKVNSKVILYYANDKRTCLHTINKLPRRTAQQVPARRPGITTGFSQASSCHTTALSGCSQPREAYNPVGIHQMAPPSTRPVNKPATHLSIPEG